ncbi:MAG: alpha/beta hydrolase [Cytophagales bacterium]|nr:MAG: alpha/beta hydrolase [Cytophagales bacterium]
MKKTLKYIRLGLAFIGVALFAIFAFYWRTDMPIEVLKEKYAPAPSQFAEVQGMQVHFRDEAEVPDSLPIVLLHGTGASLHTWDGWAKILKQKRRVIRMDLPAYGLTGANPSGDYSNQSYVSFLHAFLEKIGVEKCVLIGNSLGGSIAWHFAAAYPNRIKKLVLIDAAGFPTQNTQQPLAFRLAKIPIANELIKYITPRFVIEKSILNVYGDKSKVSEELIDRYFELSLREGNRQAFIDRMKIRFDVADTLKIKALKMPTLILWGEEDKLIPVENAFKFKRLLPYNNLLIFKGIGHVPMEENPEFTAISLQAFLSN